MSQDRLYSLLPAFHRRRDAETGEPLRALMAVLEAELDRLHDDTEQMYDDWFVETCREWVLPYLADLLAQRTVTAFPDDGATLRAFVANTVAYRRRKGTVAVAESVVRDTTGRVASAGEMYRRLAWNQHLDHVRASSHATVDLRHHATLELTHGPFERDTHTVEVRWANGEGGRYNLPILAVSLWRKQSYEIVRGTANKMTGAAGRWRFHPLGVDMPLFNRPESETAITQLASERNVVWPLRNRALHEALVNGTDADHWFGATPVFRIWRDGVLVDPSDLVMADLAAVGSDWQRPPAGKVAVDAQRGRISFPLAEAPTQVEVGYSFGIGGPLGGGPYDRDDSVAEALGGRTVTWQKGVTRLAAGTGLTSSLQTAIDEWNALPAGQVGLIVVMDSLSYTPTTGFAVQIKPGSHLAIVAADWPDRPTVGGYAAQDRRPAVIGQISITGATPGAGQSAGSIALDGLMVQGQVRVASGRLGSLRIAHCTLFTPNTSIPQLVVENGASGDNPELDVTIVRSIVKAIQLAPEVPALSMTDTILPSNAAPSLVALGTATTLEGCTIATKVQVRELEASSCLLLGDVEVTRRQSGCIRYSWVAPGSITPRRYRCQPDLAKEGLTDPAEQQAAANAAAPRFYTKAYAPGTGNGTYQADLCWLHPSCPDAITRGGEGRAEMGAWHFLRLQQREDNVHTLLPDFVRFAMSAGLLKLRSRRER
jgi:hypothetical protein